ncbi:hypothetical protein FDP41_009312 [Naegleria fowleri]|uniref:Endonuclease/exonuclease/phosphatase domain-containing protein n=1 Tax=Naegleria fowleri TaxID=5763 RepID=A0A6A5BHB5_NAEFO|nr:uncharacterized protein FDP41_009312 [Naegleria fowleri]KAF0972409.1 hypothetical protein FDP41_009312 [Naegleria fowleri]
MSQQPSSSSLKPEPQLKHRRMSSSTHEIDNRNVYRIASFNVENLLARYEFNKAQQMKISKQSLACKGVIEFGINDLKPKFTFSDEKSKQITADAIIDINADVMCLMEVESLQVLDEFNSTFLKNLNYNYTMLIDGRDPRHIDCGVLSRYPIVNVRSNRHATYPGERNRYIFSRDLLEVDVSFPGNHELTLYITHLTSMNKGREDTHDRRVKQVEYICERIEQVWKHKNYKGNFIVCGDMNDYNDEKSSLAKLLKHDHVTDIISQRLKKEDQWTHYFGRGQSYNQLDYMFVSNDLLLRNPRAKPVIYRKGLPLRASKYKGERLQGVGMNEPKASDHAAIYVDLSLE